MAVNIDALASQAAAQGQAQLADYSSKATNARGQYNQYQQQADAANKSVALVTSTIPPSISRRPSWVTTPRK
jgi:hypothetical protein